MKRYFDLGASLAGLIVLSPLLLVLMALIWFQDFRNPFYIAPRVGRGGKPFRMIKFRSMIVGADRFGVDSTSSDDHRITPIGRFIRKCKLDEFPELFNVLLGHMSLVGPRPNVVRDVELYTDQERRLLMVRPGITDLASIVFADEGDILEGQTNPDLVYNQLIRPWKSRLGLLYVEKNSVRLDFQIIFLTLITLVSRVRALNGLQDMLRQMKADSQLLEISRRETPLYPYPPPGSDQVVQIR
jgi:lipopolysaccharide/colanic/teichoic acid biosynthesis glycosyltransferase